MQRHDGWAWRGVLLFALLATGAYLAFDVLDLDGSELRGRQASGTAVAEPARYEPEARFRPDALAAEAPGPETAALAHPPPPPHP